MPRNNTGFDIRKELTSEKRSLNLQHVIDPGFVNRRFAQTILGPQWMKVVDQCIKQLPPLPEGLLIGRIGHIYSDALLEFCRQAKIKTLTEMLTARDGPMMFCSTEVFKPCKEVYTAKTARSVLIPAGQVKENIVLEYSTEHIYANTHQSRLHDGGRFAVIAAFDRPEGHAMIFRPLVMGSPWLRDKNDPEVEDWAMWYGWDYFQNFVEDFDEFSRVTEIEKPSDIAPMKAIKEQAFKECLASLLGDKTRADWGGEMSDHYTAHLHLRGRRVTAAFLLKGRARFAPMSLNQLGKNNDQIYRLTQEPADVFFIQHCHEILSPVRATIRAFTVQPGRPRRYCCIDGRDSLWLLQAYKVYDQALKLSNDLTNTSK